MKLNLVLFVFTALLFSACSHQPKEESAEKMAGQKPTWVIKTPQSADYYDAVASVELSSNHTESEQQAIDAAKKTLNQKLLTEMAGAHQQKLATNTESYGNFESELRKRVRKGLPEIHLTDSELVETYQSDSESKVYAWVRLSKSTLEQDFVESLATLDDHLTKFKHVSDGGSNLTQVLSILPALPTLEARSQIKSYAEHLKKQPVEMPNDELARLLDGRLSSRFGEIVVSMNAQTDDSELYEKMILDAMTLRGFNVSSRKPDLMIKYFVEADLEEDAEMKKVLMVSDAEMIGEKGNAFANVSKEYQGEARFEQEAKQQAIDAFCDDMTEEMVKSAMLFMAKANKNQPLPSVMSRK